jgi:hypothetical protein
MLSGLWNHDKLQGAQALANQQKELNRTKLAVIAGSRQEVDLTVVTAATWVVS